MTCAPLRALDAELWVTDATRLFSRCTPAAIELGARTLSEILSGSDVNPDCARRVRFGAH